MSWSVAQGLLAPLREAPSVGKNISERQPDVEVLAMLMNDAPTNSVAFDSLRRTNEWLSVGFAVVAVGPPGFSSVPYTSGKKDKDEATLPLYSTTEDGKTMFSTFEKVKNNKDRGKRMQEMECEEGVKSATAVLQPGLILSTFVREDTFGSVGAFFVADTQDTPDVLPAGSFVWLQLGVKNCEQAAKGQLLKFKKMKFCREPARSMSLAFLCLPRDGKACVDLCSTVQTACPAIAKQIYPSSKAAILGGEVSPRAFVTYNELEDTIMLVEWDESLGANSPEVTFAAGELLRQYDFYDPLRFMRWLNFVAIPSKAVGVAVLEKTRYEDESKTHRGVAMHIDVTRVLQLVQLQSVESVPAAVGLGAMIDVSCHGDMVLWSDPVVRVQPMNQHERRLVFALNTKPATLREARNKTDSVLFLSDGSAGQHHTLSVHSVLTADWPDACEQVMTSLVQRGSDRPAPPLIVLQLRPENRGVALHKRKRPGFEIDADDRDTEMLDALV
jgi:hypothetical protein